MASTQQQYDEVVADNGRLLGQMRRLETEIARLRSEHAEHERLVTAIGAALAAYDDWLHCRHETAVAHIIEPLTDALEGCPTSSQRIAPGGPRLETGEEWSSAAAHRHRALTVL